MDKAIKYITSLFRSHSYDHLENSKVVFLLREAILNQKQIMTALESLNASVAALTTTVDEVVTVLNTPHPTEAQVQAAADAVSAQLARLNTALGIKADAPSAPAAAVAPPTA